MKPRSHRLRAAYRILSSVFLGVFVAPLLSLAWFFLPCIREFPFGEDSPHAAGLPLGFCIGAYLAVKLNRRFNWGRPATYVGAFLLIAAICTSVVFYSKMTEATGWDGLGWLFALFIAAHVVLAMLGLTLAGLFSHLGKQVPQPAANP